MEALWKQFLQEISERCGDLPGQVRAKQPLVHLITNYVTVTDCVNALLASGARAICSHAPEEAAEVTAGSDALVLNLGGTEYSDAMELSAAAANACGIPIVIDPVGCSASTFRRKTCLHLIETYHPAAIRGNYAEIAALLEGHSEGAGLDSTGQFDSAALKQGMSVMAAQHHMILIASGAVDLITDGTQVIELNRGTSMLKRITGAGCMSSALLGAYLAADLSMDSAAVCLKVVALSGEAAEAACRQTGTGVGHFHMYFLDALGNTL